MLVTGHLTGYNTLITHLHLTGLTNSTLCRGCGAEEETSVHILHECEALPSLRHAYLSSFFLDPEDIKSLSWGWEGSGIQVMEQGSLDLVSDYRA
jgi:hypothetical protein